MIDFPANPTVGQQYTSQGSTWQWDGVKWVAVGGGPYLPLVGGIMTGQINTLAPVAGANAANKTYVDGRGSAALPIGGIMIWPTPTLPTNYLPCNGGVYNITDAPLLFAVIGAAFGGDGTTTFAVPNLLDRTVVMAGNTWGLRGAGGEINHTLAAAEMPVHAHGVSDPTHAHSLADPQHVHGIGDLTHNHGLPDPGHFHANIMQWNTCFYVLGVSTYLHNPGQTDTRGTGMGIYAAGTGIWTGYAATGQGVYGAGTGIGIYNAGSGGAHNNMPPFMALYYCMRYA